MSPIQIALLLLAVAGVWAIVELALTLRKTRNGLVHNGVENTCRHVFFLRALV